MLLAPPREDTRVYPSFVHQSIDVGAVLWAVGPELHPHEALNGDHRDGAHSSAELAPQDRIVRCPARETSNAGKVDTRGA